MQGQGPWHQGPPHQCPPHQWGGAAMKGTVDWGQEGFGHAVLCCWPVTAVALVCLLSGDSYSSSPDSTPMGSIESLSSHSSEQNSTTKSTSCQPREKSGGIPWIASPSSSNGRKSLGLWTTSPESSSREDATKTDVESDCQSVASVTSPGDVSPPIDLVKKGPYGLSGLKRASASSSLRSISAAEGERARIPCWIALSHCSWLDIEGDWSGSRLMEETSETCRLCIWAWI